MYFILIIFLCMSKREYLTRKEDLEIFSLIDAFRFLPLQVLSNILVRKKIYAHYQSVQRAIAKLEKERYIRTKFYTKNSKVIFLSKLGAKTLSENTGIPLYDINCPERLTGVNFNMLEHTIKVAELYLFIDKVFSEDNIELADFRGDHSTRYRYTFEAGSISIERYVMPDAIIKCKIDDKIKTLFIEYDRGTEYSADVAIKYTKYFQMFKYFNWKERFEEFPTILFISENTIKRILNLIPVENFESWKGNIERLKSYKNVVLRGISMHESLYMTSISDIEDFLNTVKCLFIDYETLLKDGINTKVLNYKQEQVTIF